MIGDVTFYPNYFWSVGYTLASEPSMVTQNFTSSGGETTGPLYDIVDAKRTLLLTVDTNGEGTSFQTDFDGSASISNASFSIIDNHNLSTAGAEVSFRYGSGNSARSLSAQYTGTLGEALSSDTGAIDNDGILLATFSATSSAYWNVLIEPTTNFTADVTLGEWFVGKSFSPSTAPETHDFDPNYDGIRLGRTTGGQKSTTKFYGERKGWTLKWSYVDDTDKESFDEVFSTTEGHRYPFYIDLGEEATPKLYFVRLVPGTYKARKLTTSAYEITLSIESEV